MKPGCGCVEGAGGAPATSAPSAPPSVRGDAPGRRAPGRAAGPTGKPSAGRRPRPPAGPARVWSRIDADPGAEFRRPALPRTLGGQLLLPRPDYARLGFRGASLETPRLSPGGLSFLDRHTDFDGLQIRTGAEWLARSADPTSNGGVIFGINNAHIGEYEDAVSAGQPAPRTGSAGSVVQSLRRARAQYVRQPGSADLIWPRLAVPLTDEEIYDALSRRLGDRLTELFTEARSQGLRVVLTFLTLGGATSSGFRDPYGQLVSGSAPPLDFSGHLGNTVTCTEWVDGAETSVAYTLAAPSGGEPFVEGTLDPRDPYKRCYIRKIAYQAARLLGERLSAAGVRIEDAGEVIDGIEIFNELNTSCRPDPASSFTAADAAAAWGDAVVAALEGFRDWCWDAGLGPDLFPLWLPSLSSPATNMEYDYIGPFNQALLERILLGSTGVAARAFVNQDVHWYRFRDDQGYRPAGEILAMTAQVRAQLEDLWWLWTLGAVEAPSVSVSETGASVNQERADFRGAKSEEDKAAFQAQEVYRRLCMGAVSGAGRVAWHSHMAESDPEQPFAGTGLRLDDATVATSADAHARPAYAAFTALVGRTTSDPGTGTAIVGARGVLLNPRRTDPANYGLQTAGLPGGLDPACPYDMVTILRFYDPSGGGAQLYVLFVDSAATFEEAVPLLARSSSDTEHVELLSAVPELVMSTAGGGGELPADRTVNLSAYAHAVLPHEVAVAPAQDPVVLRSAVALTFEFVESYPCGASASSTGAGKVVAGAQLPPWREQAQRFAAGRRQRPTAGKATP